jgi:hypothetical protein
MDSLITASARALAAGDALGALKRVALRDDPPALALRGIAMAQLGEHPRARELLRRAARGFGRMKSWRVRAAWWRKPKWRWPCATSPVRRAHWRRPRPRWRRTPTRPMRCRPAHRRAPAVAAGPLDEAGAALAKLDARGLPPALGRWPNSPSAELALRSLRACRRGTHGIGARARGGLNGRQVPALTAEVAEARAALDGRRRGA